jgi:hypothetical protein
MDITTESIKAPLAEVVPQGNHPEGSLRKIVFKPDAQIEHRKPGVVYEVTRDLAEHYVETTKVAEYYQPPIEAAPVLDRAVKGTTTAREELAKKADRKADHKTKKHGKE